MPEIESFAYVPPPFPTWPPASGGAPFPGNEMGPIVSPVSYGSGQTSNINTAIPYPPGGVWKATFYPQKMPAGANGQNQGAANQLPPTTKPWEVGPIKAPPSLSQIQPPPIMGPGPQGAAPYEVGPIAGSPFPRPTFPAGHYIDGMGSVVTPTRVYSGLGN
jgi:hypothetical protein